MPSDDKALRSGVAGMLQGVGVVLEGFGVLSRDRAQRRRAIVPILLTILVYVGALVGIAYGTEPLLEVIWSEPEAGWTWVRVAWLAARWGLAAVLFVGLCFLFTVVLEIVAGPFFDVMARVELDRRGAKRGDPGLWDGTVLEAIRALVMALPVLACGIAAFVPTFTVVAGIAGSAFAWFGLGAGAVNPSLVQTGHAFRARLAFARAHAGWVMGIGAAMGLALLIPVVGWAAMPAAVAGAARRIPVEREPTDVSK